MIYGVQNLTGKHPYLWAAAGLLGYKSKYSWKVLPRDESQADLYAKGRDADGNIVDPSAVVTDAKPGQSAHDYGLAIDIAPTLDGGKSVVFDPQHPAYNDKAEVLKALPFIQTDIVISSGPDRPHVQVRNWSLMLNWKAQWAGFAIVLGVSTLVVLSLRT